MRIIKVLPNWSHVYFYSKVTISGEEVISVKPYTVKPKDMLDTLTSFRFFAALLVFGGHAAAFMSWSYIQRLNLGYDGVGFFYILSGFILTYVYIDKLKTPNAPAMKRFYISRIAKLYPVHILTFTAAIPLVIVGSDALQIGGHSHMHLLLAIFTNLTLLQSWVPDPSIFFSFNGVAWSISVEVFFYLMFPLLLFLVHRYASQLTLKRILLGLVLVWTVMICTYLTFQATDNDWKLYVLPLVRLPEFIAGILLERIFVMTKNNVSVKRLFNTKNSSRVELASIVVLLASIAATATLPLSITITLWMMPIWAFVIFTFAHQKGRISKILLMKPLVFLGNISFSFYMTHQLVIRYLERLSLTPVGMLLLSLILSITISSLVYIMYEEPVRIKVKEFLEGVLIHKKRASSLVWARMINRVKEFVI